ncbi:MAG TPA: leucyl aminopeptidase [Gemmatimonadales bacterium]|nr:leucyl aminopeptidase [Gemmatimonadales bacterium]
MSLELVLLAVSPEQHATPLLALAMPRGPMPPEWGALDQSTGGAIGRLIGSGDFSGKRDQTALAYPDGRATRVMLVGTGKPDQGGTAAVRRAAAVAAKKARTMGTGTVSLVVAPGATGGASSVDVARAAAEGLHSGGWHYAALRKPPEDPKPDLTRAELLLADDAAGHGLAIGDAMGAGQTFAREVQVLPGSQCTPTYLGNVAGDLARRHGFGVTVLDRAAIEKEGMGALLAVAQGSAQEPRFIVLEYKGAEGAPVVLVGKGVTFDSGGISIKPAEKMEDMKYDMSGAAAVLGTFEMLGRIKPKLHVVGLIPSAENMPSGTAYRPGDVVKSHLGKTIEVVNTDAEGRLILADALSWARRYQPACVVDAATLTGAVVIALGHTASAVMGTDEPLIAELRAAGDRAGEPVWPLPMFEEYHDLIKSDIADMKNSGGRPGGSITAGWFLREFAEDYPWAHVDIAGTAYTDREDATRVRGPTGMGVRLFGDFLLARAG